MIVVGYRRVPGPNHGAINPQKWRVAFSVWPFYEDMMRPLSNLPDIWGEGAIFAFSGLDGPTDTLSQFVATLGDEPYNLLIHTPRRRVLTVCPSYAGAVVAATNDVLAVETLVGESGMDNSPRFDDAIQLDAVDFSTFQALEMGYVARIAWELGESDYELPDRHRPAEARSAGRGRSAGASDGESRGQVLPAVWCHL
jgi:hypothetical protein